VAGFAGIMAGSVQRQKVYVQVTELCLVAKAVRATSITPESPAKARQISSALYNPHPDDPLDEAAQTPTICPTLLPHPSSKDAAGEAVLPRMQAGRATQPNLGAGPFSAGRGRG